MSLYQKYRSQKFSDLIGQDHINMTLLEAIKTGRTAHAYLLTGPRGTGKTSTARLLSRAFNCSDIEEKKKSGKETDGEPCNECDNCREILEGRATDVTEIDAASHTGVDDIRDIIDKARFAPSKASKKVYIIDEVHMLSKSAFNALLKTLEEPPSHVIFILATTEAHKLPETILSRVQRYDFRRVSKTDIIKNLKNIAKSEGIEIEEKALDLIASRAEGSHRDSISLFEQVASFTKKISKADVENILGIAKSEEIFSYLEAIFNRAPEEGLKIAQRFFENGIEMTQFNKEVIEYLRKILLYKINRIELTEESKENAEKICKLADEAEEIDLLRAIKIFLGAGEMLKDIAYPLLPVEMATIEFCGNNPAGKRVSELSSEPVVRKETVIKPHGVIPKAVEGKEVKEIPNDKFQITNKISDSKIIEKDNNLTIKQLDNAEVSEPQVQVVETIGKEPNSSAPVIEMTSDLWEKMIDEIKKANSTLAALLRDAKPLSINGESVLIGAKFKFHKDKISEPKNCKIIEQAISGLTGNKCMVVCQILENKPTKAEAGEDLSAAAAEIFG